MTEKDRWQLWVGFIVVSVMLGFAGALVALASLSRTGLLVDLGFMGVVLLAIVAVSLRARRRPGLLVPPSMQGLDPDSRQLVSHAVSTGGRAERPELARAVVQQARRKQTVTVLFVVVWVVVVCLRVTSVAGGESGAGTAIDLMVILGSVLAASASVPSLLRARRAMAANTRERA
ncbi:MAG TPA: hypothetical protein VHT97_12405 [Acidimicrobiales bacterium]|nr:hypothetical protein [Acidimicrobiales bacterium]